jgi:peptidoglycan/LPS O-acetylase OafA/YrhL
MRESQSGILLGLQYLRFVAALLVVMTHSWQMIPIVGRGDSFLGTGFHGGSSGVDLFFVISGFIMVHITSMRPVGPGQFMLDRIARIAPPYWVITTVMAAVLILAPSVFRSASYDTASFVTSLLFIAWPSTAVPGAAPLLQIGWTLNYEMLFYAIFAGAMLVSNRYRVPIAGAAILVLMSLRLLHEGDGNVIYEFYTSTIMLEFIYGMVLALAFRSASVSERTAVIALLLATALFAYAISFNVLRLSQARSLVWGLPAALVVASVVAIDLRGKVPVNRLLLMLGNASYAIYLTHLFPLGALRKVWPMMPEVVRSSDLLLLLVAVAVSLGVGVGFYMLVERPLIRLAKSAIYSRRLKAKPAPLS